MIPAPPPQGPGRAPRGNLHVTNLYHATVPRVSKHDPRVAFSLARTKAIGKVLHSDLDMWPLNIRGEHNELLPSAVADVLSAMGFAAEERHVQAVMDEVTECQRLVKGLNHELLGRGKVGEILRQVNQIRLTLRESEATGGGGLRWEQVPCITALSEVFTAELDRDQELMEKSDHIVIRMQHDHKEFASTAESLLDELFELKRLARRAGREDIHHRVQTVNNRLLRRLYRFKWTRDELASRIAVEPARILNDNIAGHMWVSSFGAALSVPMDVFIQKFLEYTGVVAKAPSQLQSQAQPRENQEDDAAGGDDPTGGDHEGNGELTPEEVDVAASHGDGGGDADADGGDAGTAAAPAACTKRRANAIAVDTACGGGGGGSGGGSIEGEAAADPESPRAAALRQILAGFLDECGDGVTTLWAFNRLVYLFGPFHDIIPTLVYEAAGGHCDPVVGIDEATQRVQGTPGAYVVYPTEAVGCVEVVYTTQRGAVRTRAISRRSGAWEYAERPGAVMPAERLRDLIARNPAWTLPRGRAFDAVDEGGQSPSAKDTGTAPLHRACWNNNTGLVRVLMQRGGCLTANLRTPATERVGVYRGSQTPLMLSITNPIGDPLRICKLLLRAGADVNSLNAAGESCLYKALLVNRPGVIDLLREAGVRRFTAEGTEPLYLALGPSHDNGWFKHDRALEGYPPHHATVRALLCMYDSVEDIPIVAHAFAICCSKVARDAAPPPGSVHLYKAEKAAAMARHAAAHETSLRHIKRILREHLTVLETKRDFALM